MIRLENIIKRTAQVVLTICIVLFAATYLIEAIIEEENEHYAQTVCDNAIIDIESHYDRNRAKELRIVKKSFGETITCELEGNRKTDDSIVKYYVARNSKGLTIKRIS